MADKAREILSTGNAKHKIPYGDSPYAKAKLVQLVEKDPNRAVALFWSAINSGDRVDSALKDIAVVMKQMNRAEEAIEAIKSFRGLCSLRAQESLDNVLLDLYKRCGRIDEQIGLLKHKLKSIDEGSAFGGRMSKIARLLGNLAWAYMQYENYKEAEPLYRRALEIQKDYNKMCNLSICLMQTGTVAEAKKVLQDVKHPSNNCNGESYQKSYERAWEMMDKLDLEQSQATASLASSDQICKTTEKSTVSTPTSSILEKTVKESSSPKVIIASPQEAFLSPVSEKGNSGFNISVYSAKGDKTDHNTENIVIRVDIQMLRPRKKRPKDGRTVHKSRLERDEISMENLDSFAPAKGNPQPNGDSCSIKLEENEDFTCKQNLFCSSNEGSPKATSALKTGEGNSGDQKIQSQEKCWIRQTATEGTPHSQHMSWYNVKSVHQKKFRSSDRKETTVLWGGKRAIVEGFEDSDHWFGMGRRQSCGEQRKRLQVFNEIASDDATSW
ncbi:hypothetical protein HPP92_009223 [Vanilla planifolia]|uniref:Uncharacterized protein n=1 Tax=Vanilla planifolia TaxID=51239 RepID=A0A835RIW6_VANPL|nr:hypothetical protein HPP92_009223 [Vanilla planifolia]